MDMNEIKPDNDQPAMEELARLLSVSEAFGGGGTTANDVAGRLVPYAFGDEWQRLSEQQQELMIDASAQRLVFACNTWRTSGERPEEAARQAVESEMTFLTSNLRYAR